MNETLDSLRRWNIAGATFVTGSGGLPYLSIRTPLASADIYLHGAHLTHWQPAGQDPVIFMSKQSLFSEGKAIRGGVPICHPWFGNRTGAPAHGFARTTSWSVVSVESLADGRVAAEFQLAASESTRALWPYEFTTRLRATVGTTLELALTTQNLSGEPFTVTEALHTYLVVGDARQAIVQGLDGVSYHDKVAGGLHTQSGPIHFTGETDRVYINTRSACVLEDPVMKRTITVEKSGSDGTTVWNPWIDKAAAMADFGNDEWPGMVCIEAVNALDNAVTVAVGEGHTISTTISVAR